MTGADTRNHMLPSHLAFEHSVQWQFVTPGEDFSRLLFYIFKDGQWPWQNCIVAKSMKTANYSYFHWSGPSFVAILMKKCIPPPSSTDRVTSLAIACSKSRQTKKGKKKKQTENQSFLAYLCFCTTFYPAFHVFIKVVDKKAEPLGFLLNKRPKSWREMFLCTQVNAASLRRKCSQKGRKPPQVILAIIGTYNSRSEAHHLLACFSSICSLVFPNSAQELQKRHISGEIDKVGEGGEAGTQSALRP